MAKFPNNLTEYFQLITLLKIQQYPQGRYSSLFTEFQRIFGVQQLLCLNIQSKDCTQR